jgi:hypothetical protein
MPIGLKPGVKEKLMGVKGIGKKTVEKIGEVLDDPARQNH